MLCYSLAYSLSLRDSLNYSFKQLQLLTQNLRLYFTHLSIPCQYLSYNLSQVCQIFLNLAYTPWILALYYQKQALIKPRKTYQKKLEKSVLLAYTLIFLSFKAFYAFVRSGQLLLWFSRLYVRVYLNHNSYSIFRPVLWHFSGIGMLLARYYNPLTNPFT